MGIFNATIPYMKTIYLGTGGFWTPEAVYKQVKGVHEVVPGYMGGTVANPSHEVVSTGTTGHIEVVMIMHDEAVVDTEQLLKIFYAMHDESGQQYPSIGIGSQYRSVIFYTDDVQAEASDPDNGGDVGLITKVMEKVQSTLPEGASISTQIMSAKEFYPAEEHHYDFYGKNPDSVYSTEVINPMLQKIKNQYPDLFIN
ncbi:MAG: msrA [Candidatus Nomurabacteria bacterium]|nr:msrA [Candidatus Nomurabacteria bacterium]